MKVDVQKILNESKHWEVIRYSCCGIIFAACVDGLQDAEWDRNARKYRSQGHKVELIEGDVRFGKCECVKQPVKKDKNQLELL